jgi:predicted  nucleic acid-binding Zn ribbon protein
MNLWHCLKHLKNSIINHLKMNNVIIGNCIVTNVMGNEVRIRPIALEEKLNPNFNVNSLQRFTTGNKIRDNRIIKQLCDGNLKFEDLNFDSQVSQR